MGPVGRWWRKQVVRPRYGPGAEALALVAADRTPIHAVRLACTGEPIATVVLVHGITNTSRSPRVLDFAHEIAAWSDVVVPDLRGHGRSGGRCTMGEREPLDVAACVAAARDPALPVVLVGTSLGGLAAVLTAARVPVAGTYSLSAPAKRSVEREGAARMHRLTSTRPGRLVARVAFRTRIERGWWDVDDLARAGTPATERPSSPAIEARLPGGTRGFTVVAHDPDDSYFGPDHAELLHALVPGPKELWWLPGAGHGGDLLTPMLAARIEADVRARLLEERSTDRG